VSLNRATVNRSLVSDMKHVDMVTTLLTRFNFVNLRQRTHVRRFLGVNSPTQPSPTPRYSKTQRVSLSHRLGNKLLSLSRMQITSDTDKTSTKKNAQVINSH